MPSDVLISTPAPFSIRSTAICGASLCAAQCRGDDCFAVCAWGFAPLPIRYLAMNRFLAALAQCNGVAEPESIAFASSGLASTSLTTALVLLILIASNRALLSARAGDIAPIPINTAIAPKSTDLMVFFITVWKLQVLLGEVNGKKTPKASKHALRPSRALNQSRSPFSNYVRDSLLANSQQPSDQFAGIMAVIRVDPSSIRVTITNQQVSPQR